MNCENNKNHVVGGNGLILSEGKFVCTPCVSKETWRRYPGAEEKEMAAYNLSLKRSAQAKANFGKGKSHA